MACTEQHNYSSSAVLELYVDFDGYCMRASSLMNTPKLGAWPKFAIRLSRHVKFSSSLPPLSTDLVLNPFLIPFHKQELPKYHPQQQKSWNLPQPLSTQCLVKSLSYSLFHSTNAGAVAGQTKPQNLKNSWSLSGKF